MKKYLTKIIEWKYFPLVYFLTSVILGFLFAFSTTWVVFGFGILDPWLVPHHICVEIPILIAMFFADLSYVLYVKPKYNTKGNWISWT